VFDEVLEPCERLLRSDLLAGASDEPLVEEQRAAADQVAPDAYLLLPELRLERPVLGVGPQGVSAFCLEGLEDEVLDEVSGGQGGTACVESLEDLLRVLGGTEVDGD